MFRSVGLALCLVLFLSLSLTSSPAWAGEAADSIENLKTLSHLIALRPHETQTNAVQDGIFSPTELSSMRKKGKISNPSLSFLRKVLQYKNFMFISGGMNPKNEKGLPPEDIQKLVKLRYQSLQDLLDLTFPYIEISQQSKAPCQEATPYLDVEGQYCHEKELSHMPILSDDPGIREHQIKRLEAKAREMNQDSVIVTLAPGLFALKFMQNYPDAPNNLGQFFVGVSYQTFDKEPMDDYSKFVFQTGEADSSTEETVYFSFNFFWSLGQFGSEDQLRNQLRFLTTESLHGFSVLDQAEAKNLKNRSSTPSTPRASSPQESQPHLFIATRGTGSYNDLALRIAARLSQHYRPDEIVIVGSDAHIDQVYLELDQNAALKAQLDLDRQDAVVKARREGKSQDVLESMERGFVWNTYGRPTFIERNHLALQKAVAEGKKVIIYADMNKEVINIPLTLMPPTYTPMIVRWQNLTSLNVFSHFTFMSRHIQKMISQGDFEVPSVLVNGTPVPQYHESELERVLQGLLR